MANEPAERLKIGDVILKELEEISKRRPQTESTLPADSAKWVEACHEKKLFGISISGGGIRSATFGLGVLQGLAEKKLLDKADYISTVSGGGYIGGWLQGIRRRIPDRDPLTNKIPKPSAKDPITFLRKYSNYLAPREGLSADRMVIPLIWFRNTILNQTIIVSAFAALFLLLPWLGNGLRALATSAECWPAKVLAVLTLTLGYAAIHGMCGRLRWTVKREMEQDDQDTKDKATPAKRQEAAEDEARQRKSNRTSGPLWVTAGLFLAILFMVLTLAAHGGYFGGLGYIGLGIGFVLLWTCHFALQLGGGFRKWYLWRRQPLPETASTGNSEASLAKTNSKYSAWFHLFWNLRSVCLFHRDPVASDHRTFPVVEPFVSIWQPRYHRLCASALLDRPDHGRWLANRANGKRLP